MHTLVLTLTEVIVGMCLPAAFSGLGRTTGETFSHTMLSHDNDVAFRV